MSRMIRIVLMVMCLGLVGAGIQGGIDGARAGTPEPADSPVEEGVFVPPADAGFDTGCLEEGCDVPEEMPECDSGLPECETPEYPDCPDYPECETPEYPDCPDYPECETPEDYPECPDHPDCDDDRPSYRPRFTG
ncbi:MAG: hypothetical protein IT198_14240 [Acidimicrobiia bacterium]|nr:hypothetical protein [Acidimicrobiia bacterium]